MRGDNIHDVSSQQQLTVDEHVCLHAAVARHNNESHT